MRARCTGAQLPGRTSRGRIPTRTRAGWPAQPPPCRTGGRSPSARWRLPSMVPTRSPLRRGPPFWRELQVQLVQRSASGAPRYRVSVLRKLPRESVTAVAGMLTLQLSQGVVELRGPLQFAPYPSGWVYPSSFLPVLPELVEEGGLGYSRLLDYLIDLLRA